MQRHSRWSQNLVVAGTKKCLLVFCCQVHCQSGECKPQQEKIGCTSIECLESAQCSRPCFESQPLSYGHCYQANWWRSFNRRGWSKCREPYYLAGLYRSACTSLYCVEVGYCCTIEKSTWAQCGETNWASQIGKFDSWAEVPKDRFLTGLHRAGEDATIHDMDMASHCSFAKSAFDER